MNNILKKIINNILKKHSPENPTPRLALSVDYKQCPLSIAHHTIIFIVIFIISFIVAYIFYHDIMLCICAGLVGGLFGVPLNKKRFVKKRKHILRRQFLDLLEALDVALRSGENIEWALLSAKKALGLIYNSKSDIMIEVNNMLLWLKNSKPLHDIFWDFAERSGLEEAMGFATVLEVIAGRNNNTEIVRQTQQIITDTLEVEMEIATIIAEKKYEVLIMCILPIVIIGVMNILDNGFLTILYTTSLGKVIATGAILIFISSYFIAQKIIDIDV